MFSTQPDQRTDPTCGLDISEHVTSVQERNYADDTNISLYNVMSNFWQDGQSEQQKGNAVTAQ